MSDQPVEVHVSDRCEHGSFTVTVGSSAVWHLAGAGRFEETDPNTAWVFHDGDEPCECWTLYDGQTP